MSLFDVEIQGQAEFAATLLALAKCLPNDKVEPVLMEGAKVVAADAKRRAPKGPTGNLKKGIKAKKLKQIGAYPRSAAAVSNAKHAYMVEYGSPGRYKKKTGKGVRKMGSSSGPMPANPYFRQAVDTNTGPVQSQVMDGLGKLIDGAMK